MILVGTNQNSLLQIYPFCISLPSFTAMGTAVLAMGRRRWMFAVRKGDRQGFLRGVKTRGGVDGDTKNKILDVCLNMVGRLKKTNRLCGLGAVSWAVFPSFSEAAEFIDSRLIMVRQELEKDWTTMIHPHSY